MDPDAALAALRAKAQNALNATADDAELSEAELSDVAKLRARCDDAIQALDEIAEQFQALDRWLSRGGFKPQAWQS